MMKKIFKILKSMVFIFLGVLGLLTLGVILFVNTAPQMGQKPHGEHLNLIKTSPNYGENEFVNLIETKMGSFSEMMRTIPDFIWSKNGEPSQSVPVKFGETLEVSRDTAAHITWYGHSAFLIEMEDRRILIDPMLGSTASPVFFGSKRFNYQRPIPLGELTSIDAVILSHDHYDHLDYQSIKTLKDEVGHFYTALGVGSHLKFWGVPEDKITELDWWEDADFQGLKLVACPARHFSGRGLTDRNSTQWASWIISGTYQKIYFSGDGGYGPHFKEIGDKYGPFDLAMLECGQYNEAWEAIHMMPEQSVQAGIDVQGKLVMPIHWGAFKLSVHEWTDPIVRYKAASDKKGIPMIHPYIGERFLLGYEHPTEEWWKFN